MNETDVLTATARRPTSFRMELHVDPSDENEEDGTPLTTKSWRVQRKFWAFKDFLPTPTYGATVVHKIKED